MSMLRRAARRRAEDEPADGHSPAWRPCTALRPSTALRTLSLCYEQRRLLSPTLSLSRLASRPPCLSAGLVASLQGSLFAAFSVPVVRGRVQCARACFASFPPCLCLPSALPLPLARLCLPPCLCLSASLVAPLPASLSAAFCDLPRVLGPCAVGTGMFSPLALARLAPFPYLCGYEYHARQQAHPSQAGEPS